MALFLVKLDPATAAMLSRMDVTLKQINQEMNKIMADLTALTAEVARNTTVEKAALALIQGFAAQLAAAGTDPVALKALQDQLTASDDELAAAVAQNTPAA